MKVQELIDILIEEKPDTEVILIVSHPIVPHQTVFCKFGYVCGKIKDPEIFEDVVPNPKEGQEIFVIDGFMSEEFKHIKN